MIKLVAFDWNGTLLADTMACYEANQHVCKKFGRKPVTLSFWRDSFIIPIVDFYIKLGWTRKEFMKHQKTISATFHRVYEKRAAQSRSRSGTRQVLRWLIKHNVEATIFSNHTIQGIEFQLQRLGLSKYITKTIAHTILDGSYKTRTKEQKLREYLQVHKFKKTEVLIVGDSEEEIEIGSQLGIKTVAITGGYCSTRRLKAAKPDYLIHNLVDLEKIIRGINLKG